MRACSKPPRASVALLARISREPRKGQFTQSRNATTLTDRHRLRQRDRYSLHIDLLPELPVLQIKVVRMNKLISPELRPDFTMEQDTNSGSILARQSSTPAIPDIWLWQPKERL